MLNKLTNYLNLISILILIYLAFIPTQPMYTSADEVIDGNFYLANAYEHVKAMSKAPHFTGSQEHRKVKSYIIKQLQKMGLTVKTQKTNISNDSRSFTTVENIIATIKGSDKNAQAVLIMSHYDSENYNAYGAADAASGVAVILEGVRAFLRKGTTPKNDIIILITDAEEIGLMGARAFVNKHRYINNVGAVLNFEARGSSGPSYMLLETNQGNHQLLNFAKSANLHYLNSNSLAYSIYKSLPNDTDLTVFREDKDIAGFNFAFIDDHFNYHTVLDNKQNLSLDSLAHQAHYLMPLLKTLSQTDLSELRSDQDDVYFQIPFWKTVSYPFDWTLIISFLNLALLIGTITIGIKKQKLEKKGIFYSSLPLFKALIVTFFASYTLLKLVYWLHPHYHEIIQGFTYNGHIYIGLFALLASFSCFIFYRKIAEQPHAHNALVAPLFIWIIISFLASFLLPGAHFFTVISLLATLALFVNVLSNKPQPTLTLLLMAPALLIFTPVITQLPIALGLSTLPYSGLFIVLLLSTIIHSIQIPKLYHISNWVFIIGLAGLFLFAEYYSGISKKRPLPTSLYYYQDTGTDQAYLFTYDQKLTDWHLTTFDGKTLNNEEIKEFRANYWRWAQHASKTDNQQMPISEITVSKVRKYADKKIIQLQIKTKRAVDRINLINNSELSVFELKINQEPVINNKTGQKLKAKDQLARIFTAGQLNFNIDLAIDPDQDLDVSVIEISADLLKLNAFNIPSRPENHIPKPFYSTDTVITKQRITTKKE